MSDNNATNPAVYIAREGSNTVGVQFVGTRAVYNARGWIRELKMLRDGPQAFSLYFNNTKVAQTANGSITIDNFTEEAKIDMQKKTLSNDRAAFLQQSNYINMTSVGLIVILADTPPDRQNYFIEQIWAQVFRSKNGNGLTKTDADLEEVPCMLAYNLRSEDASAKIHRTFVL